MISPFIMTSGGSPDMYITFGSNGIVSIRWQDSGGGLWDMTLDTSGDVVTTAVTTSGPYLSLPFTLLEP